MPALANPRHEAFAQAIFAGLTGRTRIERAQSTAYLEAYPSCSPGPAAWTNASRLLRRAKVWERIGELQAEANKRLEPKLDLSRERIGRRLDLASKLAERQENAANIVAAELGIAKVFHRISDAPNASEIDFDAARSMTDIGRKLLQPKRTPRALARALPSLVRARISSRSNSAKPARIVTIRRPCALVVSAQASCSDLKPAPRLAMSSRILSKSRVERAKRSSRVTISTSPMSRRLSTLASPGRLLRAPLIFSA